MSQEKKKHVSFFRRKLFFCLHQQEFKNTKKNSTIRRKEYTLFVSRNAMLSVDKISNAFPKEEDSQMKIDEYIFRKE